MTIHALDERTSIVDLKFQGFDLAIGTGVLDTGEGVALVDPGPTTCLPALETGLADAGFGEVGFLPGVAGPMVIVARGPLEVEPEPGLFVLAGGGPFAAEVSRELDRRNQTVVPAPAEGDRERWRSFFEGLPAEPPLRGVAHLEAVREESPDLTADDLAAELEGVCGGALALAQGLSDAGLRPSSGTWLVTRGGQVLAEERSGALAGAALWGFGSVLGLEHGDLNPRLVDLDPGEAPSAGALCDELLYPDGETRVAWRGGGRRVARLVRLPAATGEAGERAAVRGDRSYLVTGGLGAIGLRVAGWLGERGTGAVVLCGRRAPAGEAQA